jgi:site-specific recombinase XerD
MFLSKHKNGTWYVFYENNKGKKHSKSTGTKNKNDAIKFFNQYKKKIDAEFFQDVTPITLKLFSFDYLRRSEPFFTYKTIKLYKTTFKIFIEHFGDLQLADLTTRMIEDYLLMRATKVSIFAGRRDMICLSASFNKAVKDGYLLKNPCQGIKRFKLPEAQPKFYSKEDLEKLLSVMIDNPDMKDAVIFSVNSGLRQMEMITLTWSQVNLNDRIIVLDNSSHITKTKRVRSIPLNPDAYEVIQKRYSKRIEGLEYVFTINGKMIDPNRLTQKFKKYVYASKINSKLCWHSLRHTFASWLVQSGVSIYVVSKLLGHSNVSTTEIYSHLRRDDFINAVNQLTQKRIIPETEIIKDER